jgi:type IV pilus assembly protein PilA
VKAFKHIENNFCRRILRYITSQLIYPKPTMPLRHRRSASKGFTLLEMMAVVAIIAILAAMAVPSYLFKIVREQIDSAITLAAVAKTPVELEWKLKGSLPSNNATAGLPAADKIVNNYVSSVAVVDGAINITFGNRATSSLNGKVLTLRPAVIEDATVVPITWVCAGAQAPDKMTIFGIDQTTVKAESLTLACRKR